MDTSERREMGISTARFVAFLMVFASHFFLEKGSELSNWFNAGVQVFIAISGFLYGRRDKKYDMPWLWKRAKKILVDYYVFLLCILISYLVLATYKIDLIMVLKNIFCLQAFSKGLPNIDHLWYISYVCIFYLLTPLIQFFYRHMQVKKTLTYWCLVMLVSGALMIPSINSAFPVQMQWIVCYFVAYGFGNYLMNNKDRERTIMRKAFGLCSSFFSLSVVLYIGFSFLQSSQTNASGLFSRGMNLAGILIHILFAYSFLLGISLLEKRFPRLFQNAFIKKVTTISDKYSFNWYIVHHIFIIGPYSLVTLFPSYALNVVLITGITVFSGILLRLLSQLPEKAVSKILLMRNGSKPNVDS